MIVLRLGAAVPQAPGNVGTFQVITIPLLVAGFIALAITGAKIGELQHEAKSTLPTAEEPKTSEPAA
jgi:hypothetical protein